MRRARAPPVCVAGLHELSDACADVEEQSLLDHMQPLRLLVIFVIAILFLYTQKPELVRQVCRRHCSPPSHWQVLAPAADKFPLLDKLVPKW